MNLRLLMFLLMIVSSFSVFAQQNIITGEQNPCPGVAYKYQITVPQAEGEPAFYKVDNGLLQGQPTMTSTFETRTYTYTIIWNNYYLGSGSGPTPSVFELKKNGNAMISYSISVAIKGIPAPSFTTIPSPACNFRGQATVSITPLPNATRYVWSNNAGWGGDGTASGASANSRTFTVNNDQPAVVTVTAYNDNCANPVTSRTASVTVNRSTVTATPVFASGTSTMVCPGGTGTASVSMSDGTPPAQYEWYSYQPGFLNINGQGNQFTSAAPLVTTSPSVSLTYNNTTGGSGKEVSLAVRAVYTSNCKSPESFVKIGTGEAVSDRFKLGPSEQPAAFFGVCPSAVLYIYPNNNYTSGILEQEWEVVSGDYASLTGTNPIRLRMIDDPSSVLLLRYRFRIACGWSNWNNLRLYNTTCDGLVGAKVSTTQENMKATAKVSNFNISPNPASSRISVNMPMTEKQGTTMQLTVMNLKGEVVIDRVQAAASQFQVDVSTLTPGNYILQVQSGSHRYAKQFVVVK